MVLVAAASAAVLAASTAVTDVWLDVDPAAGLYERDVDDVLALIQAFHSPELNIHGVSVVYGNAPLEDGLPIAREVVKRFGPKGLQVHGGAASAEDLGKETGAVNAMANALRERRLTILALGPLTNVGTLLKNHPDLASRIQSIVIVAGRREGQRFTYIDAPDAAFPDFNFENDPEAMQILLDAATPIVMAPWEVSSHVWLTQYDLDWLAERGGSGAFIAEKAKSWIAMWKRNFGLPGFNPFDTLAVTWLTHPQWIQSMPVTARIVEGPNDRTGPGLPPRKEFLIVKRTDVPGSSLTYCYRPLGDVHNLIRSRLADPPQE